MHLDLHECQKLLILRPFLKFTMQKTFTVDNVLLVYLLLLINFYLLLNVVKLLFTTTGNQTPCIPEANFFNYVKQIVLGMMKSI